MNTQNIQASQNESNSSNQKGVGEKHPTLQITQNEKPTNDFEIIGKSIYSNAQSNKEKIAIKEYKPKFIKTITISEELSKSSFELYKGKTIEFICNPSNNTFNATKVIYYNLVQNSLNSNAMTDEIEQKRTPPDLGGLIDEEKLQKKAQKIIERFINTKKMYHYIDRISMIFNGNPHYTYNGQTIWINDDTINPNALNDSGCLKKDKLDHVNEADDNIIKIINAGRSPVSGTWLNYHFLPKILSLCDEDYDILSTQYESLIIPYLSNSNSTYNDHVQQFQQSSLLADSIVKYIMTIKDPVTKGIEGENEVLKQLRENGFKDARLTHMKHCCDILLPREKVLIEVKAKKRVTKDDDRKYIRDLIEHNDDIHFGVFVNINDTNTPSHFAINPLRIYLHPSDFTTPFLKFIKFSANILNELIENNMEAIEMLRYIPVVKSIEETAIERYYIDFKRIMLAILARAKMDPDLKPIADAIIIDDVRVNDKIERDVTISKQMNLIDEAIKEFISLHLMEFEHGFFVKRCISSIKCFMTSKNLPKPGKTLILEKLKKYTYQDRDYKDPTAKNAYFLKPEIKDQFQSSPTEQTNNDFPTMEEMMTRLYGIEEVNTRLNNDGYETDALAGMFLREAEKLKQTFPNIITNDYTNILSENLYKECIPFQRGNENFYVAKSSNLGKQINKTFTDLVDEMYETNKKLGYTTFYKEYQERHGKDIIIIKPYSQRLFKTLIKAKKHH